MFAKEQTTLAVATIDSAGVASYSFYTNQTADWGWTKEELPSISKLNDLGVQAIQYGCLTMAMEPGNKVIEQWLSGIYQTQLIEVGILPPQVCHIYPSPVFQFPNSSPIIQLIGILSIFCR